MTQEAKHTPGPWSYFEEGTDMVYDHEENYIAKVGGKNDDAVVANCRLIAAAPELLRTIELMVSALNLGATPPKSVIDDARAAIQKATGKEGA